MADLKNEYIEEAVCKMKDIPDNEMKEVEIKKKYKVLLINQNGKIKAIGAKCPHYGGPLINGVLGDGRVKCPWHGACFNTSTGDIEDFPGLDSIPIYKVNVENDKVYLRVKISALEKFKRIKPMIKRNPSNGKIFVIIGGGTAGGVCAETLRQEGYTGRIILICKEYALPYDRVQVTKAMDKTLDQLEFRKSEFYSENGIDIMLGVTVTKLNKESKTINCSNGDQIRYDKVFIATGSEPNNANIPESAHLENIMTIRNHIDAQKIVKILKIHTNVVFLGSSFISLEAASYCSKKAKSVSIVFRSDAPFKYSFGKDIGLQIIKLCQENGVKMLPRNDIKKCIGNNGKINEVELESGETIPCDLLIMGIGGRPCTDFLKDSGIIINGLGSIDTDLHLKAKNCKDIYVGGDIANAPIFSYNNLLGTIGHYQIAQYHGKIAAANMAGKATELRAVPFFWTQLFGKNFRFTGYGSAAEIAIKGKLETFDFVVFFLNKEGYVNAVATCNRDPVAAQFAEFLKQGRKLHRDDLSQSTFGWVKHLNQK